MSDAVRCPVCGSVYWIRQYENWATCDQCGSDNDHLPESVKDKPRLVDSDRIFKIIPGCFCCMFKKSCENPKCKDNHYYKFVSKYKCIRPSVIYTDFVGGQYNKLIFDCKFLMDNGDCTVQIEINCPYCAVKSDLGLESNEDLLISPVGENPHIKRLKELGIKE